MSTATTNVNPHTEIYMGAGTFNAADATELSPQTPIGVPDLSTVRYAVEYDFTGDKLVDLLANVAVKVSKSDIDYINSDPDRVDTVIAIQTAGTKSFDMSELGNLGTSNVTLSGDFDIGTGSDAVNAGGAVGNVALDMTSTSNVLTGAAVLPKVIGSAMQLTGGREAVYRVMVNESDIVNLTRFADSTQGATNSNGDTVTLASLLQSVGSNVNDELTVSNITSNAAISMTERLVGHEILLNIFRLSPPTPGPNGATNDDTFTGDANGYWVYTESDDILKLAQLPNDINLQFILRTSQDIVDSLNARIIGTEASPTAAVTGIETSVATGRVLVLYNFKFSKQ